jgi:hypothetical protein
MNAEMINIKQLSHSGFRLNIRNLFICFESLRGTGSYLLVRKDFPPSINDGDCRVLFSLFFSFPFLPCLATAEFRSYRETLLLIRMNCHEVTWDVALTKPRD